MRRVLLSLAAAAASVAVASPALANEARVEGRGGVIWSAGDEEAIAGVAVGYDFDLGSATFAGAEITADKILTSGTKVTFGCRGGGGGKPGEGSRPNGGGGYNSGRGDLWAGAWARGGGSQQGCAGILSGRVKYRHNFVENWDDTDTLMVGLGARF